MNIPATFRSEHSWNIQIWHYINITLRYFLFHENWTVTKCFHCTDNLWCSDKIQNPNDSFRIQLWTFYEHPHLNIPTIFILNYEGIIFECSPEDSWNVPWMLPCPLPMEVDNEDIAWKLLVSCHSPKNWSRWIGIICFILQKMCFVHILWWLGVGRAEKL